MKVLCINDTNVTHITIGKWYNVLHSENSYDKNGKFIYTNFLIRDDSYDDSSNGIAYWYEAEYFITEQEHRDNTLKEILS
jgi:hypothetical protein